jgi:cell division protein FtsN
MKRSVSKKRSKFRRKFLFIFSLFFILFIFFLGVEVGQRFSGVPLKGQKKGDKKLLTNKEQDGGGITEVLDNSSEEDVPEPKITFYNSLEKEGNEENTAVVKSNPLEGHITPREEVRKGKDNSLSVSEDSTLKSQSSKYALQLGSYKNRSQAEELEKELRGKGYNAYILEVSILDKGTWYRVKVGDYEDLEQAKQAAVDLQQKESLSVIITNASR